MADRQHHRPALPYHLPIAANPTAIAMARPRAPARPLFLEDVGDHDDGTHGVHVHGPEHLAAALHAGVHDGEVDAAQPPDGRRRRRRELEVHRGGRQAEAAEVAPDAVEALLVVADADQAASVRAAAMASATAVAGDDDDDDEAPPPPAEEATSRRWRAWLPAASAAMYSMLLGSITMPLPLASSCCCSLH